MLTRMDEFTLPIGQAEIGNGFLGWRWVPAIRPLPVDDAERIIEAIEQEDAPVEDAP